MTENLKYRVILEDDLRELLEAVMTPELADDVIEEKTAEILPYKVVPNEQGTGASQTWITKE